MSRRRFTWTSIAVWLGCGGSRGIEVPRPCMDDADCDEAQVCSDGSCVDGEPLPWDELEGVQHIEAWGPDPNWDILVVLDDSSTMAQWQSTLAANIGAFIQTLDSPGLEISYRMGFTTTSVSGPQCDGEVTDGALVLSSCRGRLDDFVSGSVDVSAESCTDICSLSSSELEGQMLPTTTELDPEPRVRPWLEHVDYTSNLPDGIDRVDAARCLMPQGIAGCEREAPLEAMFRALARFADPDDPAYGFLRDRASLLVLMITDEVDCSVSPAGADIFGPDNRVFWSNPEAEAPTDAVCWNAGVSCGPPNGGKLDCEAQDWAPDGTIADEGDAVLHPLSRYVSVLELVREEKRNARPDAKVVASVITGVPGGYSKGIGDLVYAPAADPAFQDAYGIGPGCARADEGGWALPPVRLREWAESFGDRNLYSVCDDDYTPALQRVAEHIGGGIKPVCYDDCAADVSPSPGMQPSCRVWQTVQEDYPEELVACVLEDEWTVPAGANVCFYLLTDPDQEGDPHDDMSDECVYDGHDVELNVLRREGFPTPWPTRLTLACELADDPAQTCPELTD